MWIAATAAGLFAGAGLIIAIGAQNAFVLRQGLQQRHVGRVVLACAGADMKRPAIMSAPAASAVLRSILPPPEKFRESVIAFQSELCRVNPMSGSPAICAA